MTLIEICLDDIDGAVIAEAHGADRIELCAALIEGGTTPTLGTFATIVAATTTIGICVLVRQRGGDFVYSRHEVEAMCHDITAMRELAAEASAKNSSGTSSGGSAFRVEFVIGALTPGNELDVAALAQLKAACGDHLVTCHKAFDQTPDLVTSLNHLVELGFHRVLTSGGPGSASDNVSALKQLVEQGAGRIEILAGGGVRAHNASSIVSNTGVNQVHLRAQVNVPSAAISAAQAASGVNAYDSGRRLVTSGPLIDELIGLLR